MLKFDRMAFTSSWSMASPASWASLSRLREEDFLASDICPAVTASMAASGLTSRSLRTVPSRVSSLPLNALIPETTVSAAASKSA